MAAKSQPYAWCSRSNQPAPMPRIRRPLEAWSISAAIFATRAGLRYGLPATSVPSLSLLVIPAVTASGMNASQAGLRSSCSAGMLATAVGGRKWSGNQMLFQRPASIAWTCASISSHRAR